MNIESSGGPLRGPMALVAVAAVSFSALFLSAPAGLAEPYGDDDGGSYSSDDGGYYDEPSGGGMEEEPSGGGMGDEPSGGGMGDEPSGGGMGDEPSGGGMGDEPSGGGMGDEPSGGGMAGDEPTGGGMAGDEPTGGGMAGDEPTGGGMGGDEPTGGGMGGGEPSGGGMIHPAESEAPAGDITTARNAEVISASSEVASSEEVSSYLESIESTFSSSSYSTGSSLRSPVTQWNSRWTGYDRFYRPVFTNPYQTPMQLVYDYGGVPQTFTVPPLGRAAIDVPNPGVYSFTSMTGPPSAKPTTVSVGSFSGGGFQPKPGQAPPKKPAGIKTIKNALVQVKFASGTSDPFRVSMLNDLGKDSAVNNATKVLLDGEIPAWGQWTKTAKGENLFQITETQLLPGVKPPGQDPIPGYNVTLAASEHSMNWFEKNKTLLIGVGAGAGVLALALIGVFVMRRRREAAD